MTDQRIKFTEGVKVYDEAGRIVFEAQPGKTAVLPWASAQRWLRRGMAELCHDEPPAPKKKATKKAASK